MGAVVSRGVPDQFEGYEIFKKYKFSGIKLGVGATCQVHEAVDQSSKSSFAVKIIVKEEAKLAGKAHEDLLKEAEIMGKLRWHPNICHFYEQFEDKELLYFVLELCEGGTLYEKLEYDIVLEELVAKKMCKEMFKAVGYLHGMGFIHRDLRPESWMLSDLSDEGELKLSHFRMVVECGKDQSLSQPCGTLHYVAPEVLRGNYGRPSDVWTIGVLLFLMLYGSYPFDGDSASLVMHAILSSEPDWSDSCYALSSEVRDLLKRLLNKEPEKRMTFDQGQKHAWLPKGGLGSTVGSRVGSRKNSMLSLLRSNKGGPGSRRNSAQPPSPGHRPHHINAPPPLVPELKVAPGQARRPSALVTEDLIMLLEKEAWKRKQTEAKEAALEGIKDEDDSSDSPPSSERSPRPSVGGSPRMSPRNTLGNRLEVPGLT